MKWIHYIATQKTRPKLMHSLFSLFEISKETKNCCT